MTLRPLFSLLLAFTSATAFGSLTVIRNLDNTPRIRHYISGTALDSSDRRPVAGARVMIWAGGDTLRQATAMDGSFKMGPIADSSAWIKISSLGYSDTTQQLTLHGNLKLDTIVLRPASSVLLDSITVTGERPLVRWRGDTVVYNASSIKVLEGDDVTEIVQRLPGITFDEGKITFQGKTISRTYVDGKALFGHNPDQALKYLEAREIVQIEVYDELLEQEKMMGNPNGEKRTVMNLVTRSKPKSSSNMRAGAGIGSTLDANEQGKHDTRYRSNLFAGRFAEHTMSSMNFSSSNNNRGSGYNRTTSAGVSLGYRNEEKLHINGSYRLSDTRNRSSSVSRNVYFPTDKYTSRTYDDTSRVAAHAQNHNVDLYIQSLGKRNTFIANSSASIDHSQNDRYRGSLNMMDGDILNRASTLSNNKEQSYSVSENIHWNHTTANQKHLIYVNENINLSKHLNDGWQSDSLSANGSRSYLDNFNRGFNRSFGANVGYKYMIGKNSIGVGYHIAYNHSSSRRLAIDRSTGLLDTTLSSNYTRNYTAHTYRAAFERRTEKLFLAVRAGFKQSRLNKDERLPEERFDRVPFRSWLPSAVLNYRFTAERSLNVSYGTSTNEPSVEQLRNELDYSNPLSLSGGNPSLRQSYSQSASISFYTGQSAHNRMLTFDLSGDISHNNIASRRIFFTEPTTLTQFNGYVAPKGSTLTTPVNVNGGGSLNTSVDYSQGVKPLGGTLTTNLSMGFYRSPSYIDDQLNYSNSYSPRLSFGFNSTASLIYQFSIYSSTAYTRTVNSQKANNETLHETISANLTLNFFDKRVYLGANYNYTLYHNFTYSDGGDQTHILNARLGCRLLKKRQLDIGIHLSDLINRNDVFSTRTMADYITYSWTQRSGRYYMFNVAYRFNQLHHPMRSLVAQ